MSSRRKKQYEELSPLKIRSPTDPSEWENKFITIDLSVQIAQILNQPPKQYHWIKLCRCEIANNSNTDTIQFDITKTSTGQQTIPNHTFHKSLLGLSYCSVYN